MKWIRLFSFVLLSAISCIQLMSCDDRDCNEINSNCPGTTAEARAMMPYQGSERLTYTSTNNEDSIVILMQALEATDAFTQWACGPVGVAPGCRCEETCIATLSCEGSIDFTTTFFTDTTLKFAILEELDEEPREPVTRSRFTYRFLGANFKVDQPSDTTTMDSVNVSRFLNDEFYPHLIVQWRDTSELSQDDNHVWKTYFSRELGVVGFQTYPEKKLYSLLRGAN